MSKFKPLTYEEHLVLSPKFKKLLHDLITIKYQVQQAYGKSSRAYKSINFATEKLRISFSSEMDLYYQRVTSDEQFAEHDHGYYNVHKEQQ